MSDNMDVCAACGKGGGGGGGGVSLKKCTACKTVKYCGVPCQKAHRPEHKKECRKRAAELFEEALFAKPPPPDECPICMLPVVLEENQFYKVCCGKKICCGCIYADRDDDKFLICPFCRAHFDPSHEELHEQIKKRVDSNDAVAMRELGCYYQEGQHGFRQDSGKATELWLRACELGDAAAPFNIGRAYFVGQGVGKDTKKAGKYFEIGAMRGGLLSRHMLGVMEHNAGNYVKAAKHWVIAAGGGYDESLKDVKESFMHGSISKEDYAKALRSHQESKDEQYSKDRAAYFDFVGKSSREDERK